MMTVVSVLPAEVERQLAEFLAACKTGSVELHINAGSIETVKFTEAWRRPKSG